VRPKPKPKPKKGSVVGTFVGWGRTSDNGASAVSLQIIPKGKSRTFSLIVPNTRKGKFSPNSSVSAASSHLKLGGLVRANYSSLAGRTKVTSVSMLGSGGDGPFTFVGARKSKTSRGRYLTVRARKGSKTWTFKAVLPDEEPASARSRSARRRKTAVMARAAEPESGLAGMAATFKAGDLVNIEYSIRNFQFELQDIKACQMSAKGRFIYLGKRKVRGKSYDFVSVRTTRKSLALLVPQVEGDSESGQAVSNPVVMAALKALELKQHVQVSYRRQGGVMWLDRIISAPIDTARRGR